MLAIPCKTFSPKTSYNSLPFTQLTMATIQANPRNKSKNIVVREVYAHNAKEEFALISKYKDEFNYVAMDTEFPGTIYRPKQPYHEFMKNATQSDLYCYLKANVDSLNIIQVGFTLSDYQGNLPSLGSKNNLYIWQFNFSDFDPRRDLHAADSVELLKKHGIDFEKNRKQGISSGKFAELMNKSGLLRNNRLCWVTFHSAYDFAFLVKILTGQPLPTDLFSFGFTMRVLFGMNVYDVKYLTRFCDSLYGGLDKVAKALEIDRVGESHQAGSDSLLTMLAFRKMLQVYFVSESLVKYAGCVYGLEVY